MADASNLAVAVHLYVTGNHVMSDADITKLTEKIGRRLGGPGAAGSLVPAPRPPTPIAPAVSATA